MYVKFEPTNEVMDTNKTIPQVGPVVGPYTIPVIGNGGFGGPLTSGNLGYQLAGPGAAYLVWKNEEELRAQWPMDDADAVITGIDTIMAALNASENAITLKSDGTLGS